MTMIITRSYGEAHIVSPIFSIVRIIERIQHRIHEIRGERVMLDRDLALLYGVETRVFNQAVKRNIERFPDDFMFKLSIEEWQLIRNQSHFDGSGMSSQFVTTSRSLKRPNSALPNVFTEQGIAMLSGILKSEQAIKMNIAIMRTFVEIRRVLVKENDLKEQLRQIKERVGEHDSQLNHLYDALEKLLDEQVTQKSWDDRIRIGFTSTNSVEKSDRTN